MLLLGFLRLCDAEDLHLLELVDAEYASCVLAVGSGLLAEAAGESSESDGQVLVFQELVCVDGGQRLLSCSDHVHGAVVVLVIRVRAFTLDLLQGLIVVSKLCNNSHLVLLHELRGLDRGETLLRKLVDAIGLESHIQAHEVILHEITSVTGDFTASVKLQTVDDLHELPVLLSSASSVGLGREELIGETEGHGALLLLNYTLDVIGGLVVQDLPVGAVELLVLEDGHLVCDEVSDL